MEADFEVVYSNGSQRVIERDSKLIVQEAVHTDEDGTDWEPIVVHNMGSAGVVINILQEALKEGLVAVSEQRKYIEILESSQGRVLEVLTDPFTIGTVSQ
jgi:hypothetical protein